MIKNIVICAGIFATGVCQVQAAKKTDRPNIIFILCDDMGYGDLGCYGQKYINTPNIDRMAQEGMRFTQAYAGSPVSAPSRATIMTGQHSGHTHVRGNKEYWKNVPTMKYGDNDEYTVVGQEPYDPAHIILPEIMKKNGYTTGMFGKWAGGYEGSYSTPDKRGIDEYYGFICQFQAHLYYPNFLNRYSKSLGDTATVRVIMDENTIVIFSSDNGPHEEGGADPEFFGRGGKLRGLKRQCYEGGIRVPFIVRWPGKIEAGTVNDHQLAFYDIMPTFCELVGDKKFPKKYLNKKLDGDCFDGISFAPTLMGNDEMQKKHDYLYWEFHETDQMAVRIGDWKLVVKKGKPHLYDLSSDIHEDNDISASHPDIVQKMVDIIRKEHRDSEYFKVTLPL